MKKNITACPLTEIVAASNKRYLEFILPLTTIQSGIKNRKKHRTKNMNERNYKGLNFFSKAGQKDCAHPGKGRVQHLWL